MLLRVQVGHLLREKPALDNKDITLGKQELTGICQSERGCVYDRFYAYL